MANCQQLVDDLPSLIFLPHYNTVIRYFAILYEVSSGQVFVFSFFQQSRYFKPAAISPGNTQYLVASRHYVGNGCTLVAHI
jgi:hypothetical protein